VPPEECSVSTDAIFRESSSFVAEYVDKGASLVEMEAASLFAVGSKHGVDVGVIGYVSDAIRQGRWVPFYGHAHVERAKRRISEIVARLIQSDL
jgi:nucleoside phosphorylase